MYMIIVEFEIKVEFSDRFNTAVLEQANNSLNKEEECHFFAVTRLEVNANKFVLSEVYTDAAAFDYHLTTDHFLKFDALISNWVVDKAVRSLQ